jgi:hypothetical protein
VLVIVGIVSQLNPSPAAAQSPQTDRHEAAREPAIDPGDQLLIDLYQQHKILSKSEYANIRHVFADRFEAEHAGAIRRELGEPSSEFRKWLDARPEIKEEFYLALDPEHDDLPHAMRLFKELRDRFPETFEEYANLAIAVSVVWDKENAAIHSSPVGEAILPEGQMGAIENFQYYVETKPEMQGRIRYLPWEFLVYVVNHRTTLPERKWALLNYLPKRAMIGKCYGDVPYDSDSLKGEPPKIRGKLFTLPNQLIYGGVCVCQADYATRVAKSIGVPAFTGGIGPRWGGGHAWVVWVELGPVTRTGFSFSLQSQARGYYFARIRDAHTGLRTTDRELELRLHTIGLDPVAARQADLVMRAHPMLREKLELDLPQQLGFLSLVLKFCPGNEVAWKTLARMSREGQITKAHSKPMQHVLELLFLTFRNLPDFTWVVFDDMISFEDRPRQRAALYARLAGMYEQTGRIDLSCQARLKHADMLVADGRTSDAMASLATGIMLFVKDEQYVPVMLDKLDSLCTGDKKAEEQLVRFYQQFLPKLPHEEGNKYCIEMYKRGIERFERAGFSQIAKVCRMQLKLLEESMPEKKKLGRPIQAVLDK